MKTDIIAPYVLRAYAWAVLSTNMPETWNTELYGGLTPIVPVAEEPELDEFSGPHIVYGYAEDMTGDLYARSSGSMTFAVYDNNFRRLGETLNVLKIAFERQDETARDINRFSTSKGAAFNGLRFGYVRVGFVEGGTPEESEGARQSALINITYEYYVDYDNIVTEV